MPADRMYALGAIVGKARTSTARTTSAARRTTRPQGRRAVGATTAEAVPAPSGTARAAARRLAGRVSEALGKTTSEESLGPQHQRREERDVEDGLRPRGAERHLEQALADAEDHGGDRGARDGAQAADDDDRHERADPVPVQRRVDRRVERQRGPADGGGREAEAEAVAGDPVGLDADE